VRTQSSAGQNAGLPSADLELVNYGAGYGWFRRELDAAIRDADDVDQVLTQLLNRGRRQPEPRYVITDEGRRALDEAARERAMQALFGRPWPTLAEEPA
jgi:hypothetical protein